MMKSQLAQIMQLYFLKPFLFSLAAYEDRLQFAKSPTAACIWKISIGVTFLTFAVIQYSK